MSSISSGSRPIAAFRGGLGFAFLSYGLFSVADVSVKAIGTHLSVYEVSFFLALFSLVALPFAKDRNDSWRGILVMRKPALVLFRSLSGTLAGVFSILALTHVPIAEAYAVVFIAPILALVLSVVFLSEVVGWRRWSSVVAGIFGVLIVMRPGFREIEFGHLAALAAALFVATSIVCLRVLGPSERPVTIFAVLTLVNFVAIVPPMLVTGLTAPTPFEWALMILAGTVAGAAQLLLQAATRRAPANQIAPLQYSQLGWAILYGALFFAELPDGWTVVGLAFVVASGLFLIQRRPETVVVMPGAL